MLRRTAVLLALLAAGCGSAPEAPPDYAAPDLLVSLSWFAGTPLTGPEPGAAPDAEGFEGAVVELWALERFPGGELAPISEEARLLTLWGSGAVFLPASRLARGVRFARGLPAAEQLRARLVAGDLGPAAVLGRFETAFSPAVTTRVAISAPDREPPPHLREPFREELRLELSRSGGSRLLAAAVRELRLPGPDGPGALEDEEAGDAGDEAPVPVEDLPLPHVESALVALDPEGEGAVLLFPSDFAGAGGVAAFVTLGAPVAPGGLEDLVARALAAAGGTPGAAPRSAAVEAAREAAGSSLSAALPALGEPGRRRSALLWLAGRTGAPLTEDLSLTAGEELVSRIVELLLAGREDWPADLDGAGLAWLLETATVGALVEAGSRAEFGPELTGLIGRHTGELVRHPSVLEEALRLSRSVAEFRDRVAEENLVYLSDSSPAARVRACDWLASRGIRVEGYDPLGDREERRAALEAWSAAREREASGE